MWTVVARWWSIANVSFDELLRNAPAFPECPRIEATLRSPDPSSRGRFFKWLAVGAVYSVALVGIASIGLFVLPFAVIGTALVMRRTNGKDGLFGLLSGLGIPLLYVSYLNRKGPGTVCSHVSGGQSCGGESDPWIWFGVGMSLLFAGALLFMLRRSHRQEPEFDH
jgi:hypothetical protein